MTTVALDTNIISKILRNDCADIDTLLDRIDVFYIPWAVQGELLAGVKAGSNPKKYIPIIESFMNQPGVQKSDAIASNTTTFYADIYAKLKQQGTPVSPNDLWIAAECASRGLALLTLDTDFDAIPQVLKFT